jgi:hypothetical protein
MNISNILIGMGIMLALFGLFLKFGPKIKPFLLPGDIFVQKENFTFSFPIVTSIVLSIVLTILINLFRR